ncbi:AraC family transcriptional regulator [Chitiniphilus shinanonensis]|uniref:AraC family transcriptional regulator n=1 Tax=Chitiniphilus shinanonensis TaxID=553088 RepID=F8WSP0_9NEIS|nr:AraC family transcriptional regulator [Chitiniphilus shinanonensis]BAK53877.1 transcriptional regulator, AraC family [Chitiniphilus shinanonensis]GLS05981.1 AraC family transcriptional regulator [Chitiniphilus shinanonensis]
MRPQFEHVAVPAGQSWALLWRELPDLPFLWHYHPEFELTLTLNARGQRYVGDDLADFDDGDLVLVGPNLPHTWSAQQRLDEARPMLAIVVWFSRDWLAGLIRALPELAPLWALATGAGRGLCFSPSTARAVRALLPGLHDRDAAQRQPLLLEVLLLLAADAEARPLASSGLGAVEADQQRERIGKVLDHLHAHFHEEIAVDELARRAALSTGAFHRFFKRHTLQTVLGYVTQLRIGHACQQLIQTDKPVGVVAEQAGWRNLAHFNRQFRAHKGVTPREFRARYRTG